MRLLNFLYVAIDLVILILLVFRISAAEQGKKYDDVPTFAWKLLRLTYYSPYWDKQIIAHEDDSTLNRRRNENAEKRVPNLSSGVENSKDNSTLDRQKNENITDLAQSPPNVVKSSVDSGLHLDEYPALALRKHEKITDMGSNLSSGVENSKNSRPDLEENSTPVLRKHENIKEQVLNPPNVVKNNVDSGPNLGENSALVLRKHEKIEEIAQRLPNAIQNDKEFRKKLEKLDRTALSKLRDESFSCHLASLLVDQGLGDCEELRNYIVNNLGDPFYKALMQTSETSNLEMALKKYFEKESQLLENNDFKKLTDSYFRVLVENGAFSNKTKTVFLDEVERDGCSVKELPSSFVFPIPVVGDTIDNFLNKLKEHVSNALGQLIEPQWLRESFLVSHSTAREKCELYRRAKPSSDDRKRIILRAAGETYRPAKQVYELGEKVYKDETLRGLLEKELGLNESGKAILDEIKDNNKLYDYFVDFIEKRGNQPGDFIYHLAQTLVPNVAESIIRQLAGLPESKEILLDWSMFDNFDTMVDKIVTLHLDSDVDLLKQLDRNLANNIEKIHSFDDRAKVLFEYVVRNAKSKEEKQFFEKLEEKVDTRKFATVFLQKLREKVEILTKLPAELPGFESLVEAVDNKLLISVSLDMLGLPTEIEISNPQSQDSSSFLDGIRKNAILEILKLKKHEWYEKLSLVKCEDFDQMLDKLLAGEYPFIPQPELNEHFMNWIKTSNTSEGFTIELSKQRNYLVAAFFDEPWRERALKFLEQMTDTVQLKDIEKECLEMAVKFYLRNFPLNNCKNSYNLVTEKFRKLNKEKHVQAMIDLLSSTKHDKKVSEKVAKAVGSDTSQEGVFQIFQDEAFRYIIENGLATDLWKQLALIEDSSLKEFPNLIAKGSNNIDEFYGALKIELTEWKMFKSLYAFDDLADIPRENRAKSLIRSLDMHSNDILEKSFLKTTELDTKAEGVYKLFLMEAGAGKFSKSNSNPDQEKMKQERSMFLYKVAETFPAAVIEILEGVLPNVSSIVPEKKTGFFNMGFFKSKSAPTPNAFRPQIEDLFKSKKEQEIKSNLEKLVGQLKGGDYFKNAAYEYLPVLKLYERYLTLKLEMADNFDTPAEVERIKCFGHNDIVSRITKGRFDKVKGIVEEVVESNVLKRLCVNRRDHKDCKNFSKLPKGCICQAYIRAIPDRSSKREQWDPKKLASELSTKLSNLRSSRENGSQLCNPQSRFLQCPTKTLKII